MAKRRTVPERILDAALALAEAGSWEDVSLRAVAAESGVALADVHAHYAQKDDLVEAWFDRADRAMLGASAAGDVAAMAPEERIERVVLSWLEALAPHRRVTREMLAYKFEPGHVHLQALGVMRISRTVQWIREAAALEATGLQRIVEETALTTTFLLTFGRWLWDGSPQASATREFLRRLLRAGAPLMRVVGPRAPGHP